MNHTIIMEIMTQSKFHLQMQYHVIMTVKWVFQFHSLINIVPSNLK